MLQSRLGSFEGLTVLDLFAGSGALSLEALSRGGAAAFLVERDPAARAAIAANITKLGANARLVGHDACALPPAQAPADLIFMDPPYGERLAPKALESALNRGWIAPHAWITVETARAEVLDVPGFTIETTRGVGKSALHLLRPMG